MSLRETAALLHEVFGADRFRDDRYLTWFYRENPVGPAVEIDRFLDGRLVGHTGGIVQEYHSSHGALPGVFPLNLAVHAAARGRGLMTEMNEACFDEGGRRHGYGVLVGMPNAASTPGYTGRLGFRLVTPLPVHVCPPVWPGSRAVESRAADAAYLQGRAFDELVRTLDLAPTRNWAQRWTPELLRWRLASPATRYAVHAGARCVIVTCAVRHAGIPVTVVVKTFRRAATDRVAANAVIAAACRFHRTPGAIYAGFSASCRVIGVPLPDRLKPAPLNMIVRSSRPGVLDADAFVFDGFELFDFDAF